MKNNCCKKGFTLIELLVVVLIIGILAAIALPQYQKAVWKSRAAELQTIAASIIKAREVYLLGNNTSPAHFDELDLSFPCTVSPELTAAFGSETCARDGKIASVLGSDGVGTIFLDGPYAYAGFGTVNADSGNLKKGVLYCGEFGGQDVHFCDKLFHGTYVGDALGAKFYQMP